MNPTPVTNQKETILSLFRAQRLAEARALGEVLCQNLPQDAEAWQLLGIILGSLKEHKQAETCFRRALALNPKLLKVQLNLAHALKAQGRLDEARESLEATARYWPDHAETPYWLGKVCYDQGDREGAERAYRKALRLNPNHVQTHNNLGAVLADLGRLEEAIVCYKQALVLSPESTETYYNLGVALYQQGKHDEAVACYHRALAIKPGYAEVYNNLGLVLFDQRKYEEATSNLQEALRLRPALAPAYANLGRSLAALGKIEEAAASYREAIRLNPNSAQSHYNLAVLCENVGRYDEGIAHARESLHLNPSFSPAYSTLANQLTQMGKLDEGLEVSRQALRLNPNCAETHNTLGSALWERGKLNEALASYRQALRLNPNFAEAHNNLGITLITQGQLEEGMASSREAVRLEPDEPKWRGNLLLALNYHPDYTPRQLFEEHRAWGERHGRGPKTIPPHANDPTPNRRLRVGYVSPDFRAHSVASFIEPILAHHDHGRYETYCYVEIPQPKYDATTERLKKLCAGWVDTCGLSDAALAKRMRDDGIDILIDLAGHTGHNRLSVFAYKPAPVQLTYLGYPNTTGLPAIQYRITDPWADPPGHEQFHTEELIRLPHGFLCYAPPQDAPGVSPLPAQTNGYLTLGSFNVLAKTTPQVAALWADILTALPNARLLLKNRALADSATRERCHALFEARGIARERVELLDWLPSRKAHLDLYGRIDIALDTFPYNGTTTTCEALWMGVPVITLAGDRHAGRVGVSLLSRMDLTELIAQSPEEYLRLAVELAGDTDRLVQLRAGLRERMKNSGLCNAPAFTRDLEQAYREMWIKWCEQN